MLITLLGIASTLRTLPASFEESPQAGQTFASAPRTCAVLQAAYTSAIKRKIPAHPTDVRIARRSVGMTKFTLEYRARLGLTRQDFDGLVARQDSYRDPGFRPSCKWTGVPGPATDDEGHATYVTFTSPVFSKDERLAIVETSFQEEGTFGYGLICIARLKRNNWSARCTSSWVT